MVRLVFRVRRSEQTFGKRQNWTHSPRYTDRIRDQQGTRSIQTEIYYIQINGTFKMLLFLFFLHLIKYSQRNVNMSHYHYVFFSFPLYFFWFLLYVSVRHLMVYDVYLLYELYLLSLKYLSLFHFKLNFKNKKYTNNRKNMGKFLYKLKLRKAFPTMI